MKKQTVLGAAFAIAAESHTDQIDRGGVAHLEQNLDKWADDFARKFIGQ